MKYPIVSTRFLTNLCTELNWLGQTTDAIFSVDELYDGDMIRAFDIVDDSKQRTLEDIAILEASYEDYDPSDYAELKQDLYVIDQIYSDLCLLELLGGNTYANPQNIAKSIDTVSELLALQLNCKSNNDPFYDEYYCKRLVSVLAELWNL